MSSIVADIVIITFLAVIVFGAVYWLYREKKKGGCVGCPYAKQCSEKNCRKDK